jgi:signal transduction histidine kinase
VSDALPPTDDEYASTLENYLAERGEPALKSAYELGRRALSNGLGILDLAAMHHRALARIHSDPAASEADNSTSRAIETFFIECLSPFEMVHRGFSEANSALRHINEALEKETKRFAHAVHDEVGPLLVSVHFALEGLTRDLPVKTAGRIAVIRSNLDQVEAQLRRLSHELRPMILEDLGLVPALRFLAEGVSIRTGVSIDVEGADDQRMAPTVETALYRIVQEALHNVGKHARATRATVRLARDEKRVWCSITDDGTGFEPLKAADDPDGGGLGLVGIKERLGALGGSLQIRSDPGRGAELFVSIPLEARLE